MLRLQKFCSSGNDALDFELGPLRSAFPNGSFPVGAIHELLSSRIEDKAASCGFLSGLLSRLMKNKGAALWISASRTVFPPALKTFGIHPDHIVFLDLQKEKDVLWTMDEALKCGALTAVVAEIRDLSFTASRRLQLAVEQSQVTGFVLRHCVRDINTTACVSRWKVTALPSEQADDLPGIGFPKWSVELLRMRNGKAGAWDIQWKNNRFTFVDPLPLVVERKKAG